jgi:hypothetical protein
MWLFVPRKLRSQIYAGARRCVPELATQLASGEGTLLREAIEARKPFGLVFPELATMTDLYMPNVEAGGKLMYRGIDSDIIAVRCEQGTQEPLLVFSAGSVELGSSSCSGELMIGLRSGEARTDVAVADATVPFFVELGLSNCAASSLSPEPSASTDLGGISDSEAACWLARALGPQRASASSAQSVVELALPAQIALTADLIVRRGTTLRLRSAATTRTTHIIVGPHQIRVEAGCFALPFTLHLCSHV